MLPNSLDPFALKGVPSLIRIQGPSDVIASPWSLTSTKAMDTGPIMANGFILVKKLDSATSKSGSVTKIDLLICLLA